MNKSNIFKGLRASAILSVCLVASGCMSKMAPEGHFPTVAEVSSAPADLPPYQLQVGDVLSIRFYRNPELDQEVAIRPDGKISLPFIDEVLCAGLTPSQLDGELTRRYRGELTIPDITVIVTAFGGNRIYVDGEVENQGMLDLAGGLTLRQAIAAAGGVTDRAHSKMVVLIRTDSAGQRTGHALDYAEIRAGTDPMSDVPLKPYDVVYVPKRGIANANVAMRQWVHNMLPIRPGLSLPTN